MEFRNLDQFEKFLEKKAERIAKAFVKEAEAEFRKQIERLNKAFLSSSSFKEIKSSLAGEYGFTKDEIANLGDIVNAMSRVSKESKTNDSFVIQYVNLEELHAQPEAQHALTSEDGTEVISWTKWLEEGATVLGYSFSPKGGKESRSGEGVMKKGGAWRLRPARGFTKLRKNLDLSELKKRMSLVVKRVKKKV